MAWPPEDTRTEAYRRIKALHAEFHKTVATILELALAGKREQALKELEYGRQYGNVSGALIMTLNDWQTKKEQSHERIK